MGSGQSLSCAIPADTTLAVDTYEDVDAYVSTVRSDVEANIESFEDRFKRYMEAFEPDVGQLKLAATELTKTLGLGLRLHSEDPLRGVDPDKCCLKMLDAFAPRAPTGNESGIYYAADFGGSNFRILRCVMNNGEITVTSKKASLMECKTNHPKGLLDPKATATEMFDFFAGVAADFLKESGDIRASKPFPLGFTFSYPCTLRNLSSGELICWTKGFETGRDTIDPVEGCDIAQLLNMALQRKRLPLRVTCVANDTVGTLLSCAYSLDQSQQPPCAIGVILGTGVNSAYVDDRAPEYKYNGPIVNVESGNFNIGLPRTNIDYEVDFADVGGRGRQQFEKMVSGAYLGEICRRACVKIFQYQSTPKMWQAGTFTSEDASICMGDKSEQFIVVDKKMKECWGAVFTTQQLRWVRDICSVIFRRSAALSAMLIAGTAIKTGRLQQAMGGLTVGVDGSLWKCNPKYRHDLRHYLEEILGKEQARLIYVVNADDGSGLGAAILAAVADRC